MAKNKLHIRSPGAAIKRGLMYHIDRMFFDQRTSPKGFLIRSPQKSGKVTRKRSHAVSPRIVAANIGLLGLALATIGVVNMLIGVHEGFILLVLGVATFLATIGVMAAQIISFNRVGRR